jgi:hypothetical protein
VFRGRFVFLFGGGEAVSTRTVVRIDSVTGHTAGQHDLDEPLSDLGAATVRGRTYLVGGYTGSKYASAVLRVEASNRTKTVARLPVGLRYAGVAALGGKIYVAGGITPAGESRAVYVFDPAYGTVQQLASLPAPEAHAALAALDGQLYLVGGRSVLRIDPSNGSVLRAATLPQSLTDPNAVTLGGRIVVLGGGTDGVLELRVS